MRKTSLTFRFLAGLAILSGLLVAFAGTLSASAVTLRQNSVVTGNTVTLGDVFHGLSRDAEKVLGPAPRPGHDMVLNARTLLRIAVALDLPWRPSSNADYVVLSRNGSVIDTDMIKEALHQKMEEDNVHGKYNLILNGEVPEMILPADLPSAVEISSLNIKPEKNWFEATLAAPSVDNPVQSMKVTGTMQRLINIPVLAETLGRGDIIGAHDIQMVEIHQQNLKDDVVINPDNLIGMAPRRTIISGEPVKALDLESPRIVARGELVTVVFRDGPLLLTAQGKALEHGAKGTVIRVVNTSSNKTLQGEVTGEKEITVRDF